jgi:hypothetical protein
VAERSVGGRARYAAYDGSHACAARPPAVAAPVRPGHGAGAGGF